MIIGRRSFLIGAAAGILAPALVRAENIMPVRTPIVLRRPVFRILWSTTDSPFGTAILERRVYGSWVETMIMPFGRDTWCYSTSEAFPGVKGMIVTRNDAKFRFPDGTVQTFQRGVDGSEFFDTPLDRLQLAI